MLRHEIFISNEAVSLINKEERDSKSKVQIQNEVREYCDKISQILGLKIGMSVMLVVRSDNNKNNNVWFVYNQCLDTSSPSNPNNIFLDHNPSLNIDTHIFKPIGGRGGVTKHPANKYHSWSKKRSADTIFEGRSKKHLWK
jgi:hypothetical protein